MIPLGREVAPGIGLISPLGKEYVDGMSRFCRCPVQNEEELQALRAQCRELLDFVAGAAARYGFDPQRVVAMGYSSGAIMASSILLFDWEQEPAATLAGAIVLRPLVPFEPERLPALDGLPVFIAAGTNDPLTPASEAEQLTLFLRRSGAEVALHRTEAEHKVKLAELRAAKKWATAHWG